MRQKKYKWRDRQKRFSQLNLQKQVMKHLRKQAMEPDKFFNLRGVYSNATIKIPDGRVAKDPAARSGALKGVPGGG